MQKLFEAKYMFVPKQSGDALYALTFRCQKTVGEFKGSQSG